MSQLPKKELVGMGLNGKKYCDEYFTIDKSVAHLESLLQKTVGTNKAK